MPPGQAKIEGYKEDEQITAGDSLTLACLCKAGKYISLKSFLIFLKHSWFFSALKKR